MDGRLGTYKTITLLSFVALAFISAVLKVRQIPASADFLPQTMQTNEHAAPTLTAQFVSNTPGPHRHAPSILALKDGRLLAFWFSGSKEGASDVEIRSAFFDPKTRKWGQERSVIDKTQTERALLRYVKKLGNPVPVQTADGTLLLYYVTVSLGGWAGSSITMTRSFDEGKTWTTPQRLITSPFLNISTLVKGTPFLYADGTIGLPVYHEFIGKFAELLRLDTEGRVLDKQRLTDGKKALQPIFLVQDAKRAQVLMRRGSAQSDRVIGSSTQDAGAHFLLPFDTALFNPNAALSGLALPNGVLLVVLNNTKSNRDELSLLASQDGGTNWKTLLTLEQYRISPTTALPENYAQEISAQALATDPTLMTPETFGQATARNMCHKLGCGFEFSYPYLIASQTGDLHLLYTWHRSFIKHVAFSQTWVMARLKEDEK